MDPTRKRFLSFGPACDSTQSAPGHSRGGLNLRGELVPGGPAFRVRKVAAREAATLLQGLLMSLLDGRLGDVLLPSQLLTVRL